MAVSLYDASIPGYVLMLKNLAALLEKAEAHAKATGVDPQTYLDKRLAPDMGTFTAQIQLASDAAKGGAARLAGVTPPSFPDNEATWAEVKDRVTKTIAFLESIDPAKVNGDPERTVELPVPGRTLTFTARDFLFTFSLPNFHFHVVTAYGLLRAAGVPLGKLDYLAGGRPEALAA
jgi:uncharacterized protein